MIDHCLKSSLAEGRYIQVSMNPLWISFHQSSGSPALAFGEASPQVNSSTSLSHHSPLLPLILLSSQPSMHEKTWSIMKIKRGPISAILFIILLQKVWWQTSRYINSNCSILSLISLCIAWLWHFRNEFSQAFSFSFGYSS